MGIARTWVFPILRILLVAIIAAALIKLAFFPDRPADAEPAQPTGAIVEPRVAVTSGTITNDVVVSATVAADPAVPLKSTAAGTVNKIVLEQGSTVAKGDVVFTVKVPIERDPADSVDDEGKPKPAIYRYEDVAAPAAGTLSSLSVIAGQEVTVGAAAGNVAPPTFSVTGTLEAAQQYRLLNRPTDASVTITGGPAAFTCTDLRITTPLAGSGDSPSSGAASSAGAGAAPTGGGSGTTATCAVPGDVTVFSGLAAQMTISGGAAENVLVVPTTAVRGAAQSGTVWVTTPDGGAEERAVALGLTDGTQVQITQGLAEGDEILEFAPGAMAPGPGDGCTTYPDGSMSCEAVPLP